MSGTDLRWVDIMCNDRWAASTLIELDGSPDGTEVGHLINRSPGNVLWIVDSPSGIVRGKRQNKEQAKKAAEAALEELAKKGGNCNG